MNSMLRRGSSAAYQMTSGPNPADFFSQIRRFRGNLPSRGYGARWRRERPSGVLRTVGSGACCRVTNPLVALMPRRETRFSYNLVGLEGAPKWCGPAVILEVDKTGVALESLWQTFKVARCRVRNRVGAREGGEEEWNPASDRADEMEVWPSGLSGERNGEIRRNWNG